MGIAGPGDPPVQLWEFRVSRYLQGTGSGSEIVVRYDSSQVASGESSVQAGRPYVAFLSPLRAGTRIVVGGDQGLATVDAQGRTRSFGSQPVPGMAAESVAALEARLRRS